MIRCDDCLKRIGSTDETCPHCGARNADYERPRSRLRMLWLLLVAIVVPTVVLLAKEYVLPTQFAEPELAAAVMKAAGGLTHADVKRLAKLSAPNMGIADLSGIETLTSLTELDLGHNQISDVAPLAKLENLTSLQLNDNSLRDITPLAALSSLDTLGLSQNQISDVSPLATLKSLTKLSLDDNPVRDVTPLAKLPNIMPLIDEPAIASSQGSPTQDTSTTDSVLPEIVAWLELHSEYGTPTTAYYQPDWAFGKRQQVSTSVGSYLFYVHKGDVSGVWEYQKAGGKVQVFHRDLPPTPKNVKKAATTSLPTYTIIAEWPITGGGRNGDFLIPSFSRDTSKGIREATFRQMVAKEGFASASFYRTQEAQQANMSEIYSEAHPGAMRNGYLGMLDEAGVFTAAEELYP